MSQAASPDTKKPKFKKFWMPLNIGDLLSKTQHFSLEEIGAYVLLRSQYWTHGGLPADDERVRLIARMTPKQWRGSRETLANLFAPGWRDPEMDAALAEAEETHIRLSEAGQRGGQAKARRFATGQAKRSQATSPATSQATSSDIAGLEASPQPGHKPGSSRNSKPGSSTSHLHPFGSPGRSDRVLPSQDCGDLRDAPDAAPALGWDEQNPFGADVDGEAAA